MDVLTKEQRRYCMSRIRGKKTTPELVVRSVLRALGFRMRYNVPNLPGKPDIVIPSIRTVIFVHGCFWHGHQCRYGRVKPRTNAKFWSDKVLTNRRRDSGQRKALRGMGWNVVTVWECKTKNLCETENRLKKETHLIQGQKLSTATNKV